MSEETTITTPAAVEMHSYRCWHIELTHPADGWYYTIWYLKFRASYGSFREAGPALHDAKSLVDILEHHRPTLTSKFDTITSR